MAWTILWLLWWSTSAVPASSISSRRHDNGGIKLAKSRGHTVILDDVAYYVPGDAAASFTAPETSPFEDPLIGLLPISLVHPPASNFSSVELKEAFQYFDTADDVWTYAFSQLTIVRPGSSCSWNITSDQESLVISASGGELSDLPQGPYFLTVHGTKWILHKAFRLYNDYNFSFYYGVFDEGDGSYSTLAATHPWTDGSATIAVPSRLYYPPPSAEKPLSGVRIGLKDIYDLKGLKTSMGNRPWFHLYPPANETAVSVQRLIDLGGIIVGKTRTSQFANGENPTINWVDYHMSFTPRADGYQDPSSSSTGAGSAEASYDWIDMNIGSDTGGSVRAPAGQSGVFGNRPSQGAFDITGVIPLSPSMDTLAFVARSADSFSACGKAWHSANPLFKSYPAFPSKLIYPINTPNLNATTYPSPGFFPSAYNASRPLFEAFVSAPALETVLHTNRTFFADHAAVHDGDEPHLDPPVRRNYEYGLQQTDADRERILAARRVLQEWVRAQLLTSDFQSEACSGAVLVRPLATGAPNSREVYGLERPSIEDVYLGWNKYGISQLAGVPEVVIPLGAVPFESPVTKTVKMNPVAVSLLAGYGCDFMLFDLVVRLKDAGAIPASVRVGENL